MSVTSPARPPAHHRRARHQPADQRPARQVGSGRARRFAAASLACALLSGGILAAPAPAAAAPQPSPTRPATGAIEWSVTPVDGIGGDRRSSFDFTVPPGTTLHDAVTVANHGGTPLTLSVYATDAFTTPDGSFALLTAEQKPTDLGSWIRFDAPSVTVPPGGTARLPFHLTVPSNATPGDHAAGIVASRRVPGAASGDAQLAVDQRVGTRVYLRVNGPLRPDLTVTELTVHYGSSGYPVSRDTAKITYTVRNGGNIRLAATARVSLLAPFGITLARSQRFTIPALLPNETYTGTLAVSGGFPSGRLTARMDLDGVNPPGVVPVDLAHRRHEATIWAVPWLLVCVIVAVVLAVWPGRRLLRRLRGDTQARRGGRGTAAG